MKTNKEEEGGGRGGWGEGRRRRMYVKKKGGGTKIINPKNCVDACRIYTINWEKIISKSERLKLKEEQRANIVWIFRNINEGIVKKWT